jgi:hypothetical protein
MRSRSYRVVLPVCISFLKPDSAVVLDLPYPAASACDVCRTIVKLIAGLPFVILSASSDVADRVLLMETGADDYVTIPFSPKQLVKRLHVLMSGKSLGYLGDMDYVTAESNRVSCRKVSAAVGARCSRSGCLICSVAQYPSLGRPRFEVLNMQRVFYPSLLPADMHHSFAVRGTAASLVERVNDADRHLCEIAE